MKDSRIARAVLVTVVGVATGLLSTASGQQVHRNGFEMRDPGWSKGAADAAYRESLHGVTAQTFHTGQSSEHIQLTAEAGSFIHYFYSVRRAAVSDELNVSLWVKANRPGLQLMARLVLPRERDPNNLDDRLTTLLRGDVYQLAGRWQRLELRHPVKLTQQQQQLMRAELKRDVDFSDAFIDRLVLNVYGGPGLTDVWIDDLEVSPVLADEPAAAANPPVEAEAGVPAVPTSRAPERAALIDLNQEQLRVGGKSFLFRGIRVSDTPLSALRDARFNTVWLDYATPAARLEEAARLGFWVVPSLPVAGDDPRLTSLTSLGREVTHFPAADTVLFWDLGGGLMDEQTARVAQAVRAVRAADSQHPLGGDVWDGLRPYSRHLDLVGVHRWPLLTGLELWRYRSWLNQRRLLARPGTFFWTWVQTHLPDWYTALVYDRPGSAGFDEPVGPQPEQIRLLSYIALTSGCRGLGFWSDRFLADSHQGRDRLLALALLNLEMEMLEPLLLAADQPVWIDTEHGDVKAAVLRSPRGVLALPVWIGRGAQFVPGQSATAKLKMVVPEVPAGTQAWLVSPAEVRSLPTERVAGGTQVTLNEFGLTAVILFTADNGPNGLLVQLQNQVRVTRKMAAQWSHDLAQAEMDKVEKVERQLEAAGQVIEDGAALMENARARLKASEGHWANGDYREAYLEAERSLRPLRILMRAQWVKAATELDAPVCSPYAVSFYTLPRHWRFVEQIRQTTPGANVLPDGDFEQLPRRTPEAWTPQEVTLDEVELDARRVTEEPREGKQCLRLVIKPINTKGPDGKPLPAIPALERTFLAINSPVVRLPPGSLVRVSAWINVPSGVAASEDGALFYDSAGGEPLAIRIAGTTNGWKKYTLYRTVPASGTLYVTLALTGIGRAFFDDVRIEPLTPGSTALRSTSPTGAGPDEQTLRR